MERLDQMKPKEKISKEKLLHKCVRKLIFFKLCCFLNLENLKKFEFIMSYFIYFYFILFYFCVLGPHMQHMEISSPRLRAEELKLTAYATATVTQD